MLLNIMKDVEDESRAIIIQNDSNASRAFSLLILSSGDLCFKLTRFYCFKSIVLDRQIYSARINCPFGFEAGKCYKKS